MKRGVLALLLSLALAMLFGSVFIFANGGITGLLSSNQAPTLLQNTVNADANPTLVNLNDYFSDADGDSLTYSTTDTLVAIDGNTLTFATPAGFSGDYTVTITASDGENTIAKPFTLNVPGNSNTNASTSSTTPTPVSPAPEAPLRGTIAEPTTPTQQTTTPTQTTAPTTSTTRETSDITISAACTTCVDCTACAAVSGSTCTLSNDISATGTCITIAADNVILDCAGFSLFFDSLGAGGDFGVDASSRSGIGVKNCNIADTNAGGANGIGIRFTSVTDSNITATIQTNGTSGNYGVQLSGSSRNNITGSTINSQGTTTGNYGVRVSGVSIGNLFDSNIVTTNGTTSNYGFSIENQADTNTIQNTIISTNGTGTDNVGIIVVTNSGTRILDNTIVTNGSSGNIGINTGSMENGTIDGNAIYPAATAGDAYGIYLSAGLNNFVRRNIIRTTGTTNDYGFRLQTAHNNTIYNNSVTTLGTSSPAVYILLGSENNTISNNTFAPASGNANHGIDVQLYAINNTFANNTILVNTAAGTAYGISLTDTANNTILRNFINVSGAAGGDGIELTDANRTLIENNTIVVNNTAAVRFDASANNTVNNNTLFTNSIWLHTQANAFDNRLSNTTFNTTNTTGNGSIFIPGNSTIPASSSVTLNKLYIRNNLSHVNTTTFPFLNSSANITLRGLTFTGVNLLVDPEDDGSYIACASGRCTLNSYSGGVLQFNVSSFTSYAASENSSTCGTITTNTTLVNNISSTTSCITFGANNLELNCNGYTILYNTGAGNTIGVTMNTNNGQLRNCNIIGFPGTTNNVPAISLGGSTNNRIFNNNITVNGGTIANYGIQLSSSANLNNITNNTITVNATTNSNLGVRIFDSSHNLIADNSIANLFGNLGNQGIYIVRTTTNNTVRNNTIYINGSGANYGIQVDGFTVTSTLNKILDNKITTNGTSNANHGIVIDLAESNTIGNNTIETGLGGTGDFGIQVSTSANSNFFGNNNITAGLGSYAIDFTGASSNNTFDSNIFNDSQRWIQSQAANEYANFTNTTFLVMNNGSIRFPGTFAVTGIRDITRTKVNITLNRTRVNSTNVSFLNTSANITLRGLPFAAVQVLIDPEDDGTFVSCGSGDCTLNSYTGGTAEFNVSHFTSYAVSEDTVSCGDTITTSTTLTSNLTSSSTCLTITGNDVTLDCNGYTISGNGATDQAGVNVTNNLRTTIKNCNISNWYYGVWVVEQANYTTITLNNLTNNTVASVRFNTSTFYGNVTQNNVRGPGSRGIWNTNFFAGPANHIVHNNTVSDVQFGIMDFASSNITNNYVTGGASFQIYLQGVTGNRVENNILRDSSSGMLINSGANNNNLTNNTIINHSSQGLRLSFNSGNILRNNTFANNSIDIDHQTPGTSYLDFNNDVDTSNTVDGLPVYYFIWTNNTVIENLNTKHLTVAMAQNVTIRNINVTFGDPVTFAWSGNISVNNVSSWNAQQPLQFVGLSESNVSNTYGVNPTTSSGNQIYRTHHVNFTNLTLVNSSGLQAFFAFNSHNNTFNHTVLSHPGTSTNTWITVQTNADINNTFWDTTFLNSTSGTSLRFPLNFTPVGEAQITSSKINLAPNRTKLDASNLTFMNTTAQITLPGLAFTDPRPLFDANEDGIFTTCNSPQCVEDSYTGGTFIFNVTHFSSYAASENVVACGDTLTSSTNLTQNLTGTASCLTLGADNIVLDCQGNTINYSDEFVGVGINATSRLNVTIKNCLVGSINKSQILAYGILLSGTNQSQIYNVTVQTGNSSDAIRLTSAANNTVHNFSAYSNGLTSNSGSGVIVDASGNNLIANGTSRSAVGNPAIFFSSSNNNLAVNVSVSTQNQGLYAPSGTNNTFRNCSATGGSGLTLSNQGTADNVDFISAGTLQIFGNHNRIINSRIVGTTVTVFFGTNQTLINNTLTSSDISYGASDGLIANNTLQSGMSITGNNNTLSNNTLTNPLSISTGQNNTINQITFSSNTTWLSSAGTASGNTFANATFENSTGSIYFTNFTLPGNTTVGRVNLSIEPNRARLSSTNLSFLNTSAQITLKALSFTDPRPRVDFEDDGTFVACNPPQCTEISYNGSTYVFNVSSFTTYISEENVTACGTITSDTALTSNISSSETCINFGADDITLDCRGYTITYANGSLGYGINATGRNNIVVKNCIVVNASSPLAGELHGIYFNSTDNSAILNTTTYGTGNGSFFGGGSGLAFVVNSDNNNITNTSAASGNYGLLLFSGNNNRVDQSSGTGDIRSGFRSDGSFNNFTNSRASGTQTVLHFGSSSVIRNITANGSVQSFVIFGSDNIIDNITAIGGDAAFSILSSNSNVSNVYASGIGATNFQMSNGNIENLTAIATTSPAVSFGSSRSRIHNFTAISGTSYAIFVGGSSDNNNISNANLQTNSGTVFGVVNSENNTVTNTTLATNSSWILVLNSFATNFTNSTFIGPNATLLFAANFTVPNGTEVTGAKLNVSQNRAFINTSNLSFINTSARITLDMLNFGTAQQIVDFQDDGSFAPCTPPDCTFISYNGSTIVFDVAHFTSFSSTQGGVTAELNKSDDTDPFNISIDTLLNYTINFTVTDGAAFNITINETYPAEVSFVNSTPTPTTGNNSWDVGNLSVNSTYYINITVNVSSALTNGYVLNNAVNATYQNSTGNALFINVTEDTTITKEICPVSVTTDYTLTSNISCAATAVNILADNVVFDCAGYTIQYANATNGVGVNATGRTNATVRNCIIEQASASDTSDEALLFTSTSDSFILNNTVRSVYYSLSLTGSGTTINNNSLWSNGTGVETMLFSASSMSITNNTARASGGSGTGLDGGLSNSRITDNSFNATFIGLNLANSNSNIVDRNTALADNLGMRLSVNSNDNNASSNFAQGAVSGGLFVFADRNTLVNNTIYSATLDNAASENRFFNNTFIATGVLALSLGDSNNNSFFNTSLNHSGNSYALVVSPLAGNTSFNLTTFNATRWILTDTTANNVTLTNTRFNKTTGTIHFPFNFTLAPNADVTDARLNISSNRAFVNSTNLSFLNTTAQITLEGIVFTDPRPRVDFEDDGTFVNCNPPQCTEISYNGSTYVFNVSSFTTYISAENATDCGTLLTSANLTENVTSTGTCITFGADNIALDCAGYTINYSSTTSGNGVFAQDRTNVTVKNCLIYQTNSAVGSSSAIKFSSTNDTAIINTSVNASGASSAGIHIDLSSRHNITNVTANASPFPALFMTTSYNANVTNFTGISYISIGINPSGGGNHTFTNVTGTGIGSNNGIQLDGDSADMTFNGFSAYSNSGTGISSQGGANNRIENGTAISLTGNAVLIIGNNITLANVSARSVPTAIIVSTASGLTIRNVSANSTGAGITLSTVNDSSISNSYFIGTAGLSLNGHRNNITNVRAYDTAGAAGFLLQGGENNTIQNSLGALLAGSGPGILLQSMHGTRILNTTGISPSQGGISVQSNSNYTQIINSSGESDGASGIDIISGHSNYVLNSTGIANTSGNGISLSTENNTIANVSGTSASGSGISVSSSGNTLANSTGASTSGFGIGISGTANNVTNNTATTNTASASIGALFIGADQSLFTNNTAVGNPGIGLKFGSGTNNTIAQNTIIGDTIIAVYHTSGTYNLYTNNDINGFFGGIQFDSSANDNTVIGNRISTPLSPGVQIGGSSHRNNLSGNNISAGSTNTIYITTQNNTIVNNTITNAGGASLQIDGTSNPTSGNTISGNSMNGSGAGVLLMQNTRQITATNNTIQAASGGIGILAITTNDSTITNNAINGSGTANGIQVQTSSNSNIISHNTITGAVNGLLTQTGLNTNNTFYNNTVSASASAVAPTNIYNSTFADNSFTTSGNQVLNTVTAGRNTYANNTLTGGTSRVVLIQSDVENDTYVNNTLNIGSTTQWFEVTGTATNTTIYNTTFNETDGRILLTNATLRPNSNIALGHLNITANRAHLNTTNLSFLNSSARITLDGLLTGTIQPLVDFNDNGTFAPCVAPDCASVNYNGSTFVFDVSHFTSFSSTDGGVNLTLTKTDSPDPVNAGSTLTYTITTDITSGAAHNLTIVETYPINTTFNGSTPAPTTGNNSWLIGNVTNTTYTITLTLNVSSAADNGSILSNTVNATYQNSTGSALFVNVSENTTVSGAVCPYAISTSTTLSADINCPATAVNINANNLVLDCAGYTINYSNTTVGFGINATGRNNITIRNCNIVHTNASILSAHGIALVTTANSTVANNNVSLTASNALQLSNVNNTRLENNTVSATSGNAINLIALSFNNTFTNNTAAATTGTGISASDTNNNTFTNMTVSGTSATFIFNSDNNTFARITATSTSNALQLSTGSDNNTIRDSLGVSSANHAISIVSNGNLIVNTTANGNTQSAVLVQNAANNTFINDSATAVSNQAYQFTNVTGTLVLFSNGSSNTSQALNMNTGSTNNTLFGGRFTSNTSQGIIISASLNNTVQNNTATTLTNQAIRLDTGTNNTLVANNTITSNGSQGLFLLQSNNNTITNNIMTSTSNTALQLVTSSSNAVANNSIASNTSQGMSIQSASIYNNFTNNTVFSNTSFAVVFTLASGNNTFVNNTATTNAGVGIFISTSALNNFTNNNINSRTGILFATSPNTIFNHTNITANGTWMIIDAASVPAPFSDTLLSDPVNGSIYYPQTVTAVGASNVAFSRINISNNTASVNSANLTFLNTTAQVRLNNIVMTNPAIIVDFNDDSVAQYCTPPQCTFVSYLGGTLVFNVSGFTTYSSSGNITIDKLDTPDPVAQGGTITYQLQINNTGSDPVSNVTVVETYPAGISFVTSTPAPTLGNNTFVLGTLAAGANTTINITVTVGTNVANGTLLNNTMNMTFANPQGINVTSNDTETTTVSGTPLILTTKIDSPDPVAKGTPLNYTITITNSGTEFAYNLTVVESYASGTLFVSSVPAPTSGNDTFVIGTLAAGTSTTINITMTVSPSVANGTVLNNTYNVTFANSSGQNTTVTNSTLTTVLGSPIVLTIKSDTPDPVVAGTQLAYSILVNNTGDDTAFNVSLTEIYPAGVSFVSGQPAPIGNNTFPIGTLLPNQSVLVNITVIVGSNVPNGTVLVNNVNASFRNSTGAQGNASDSETTTVIGSPTINITKTSTPNPTTNGSNVTYTITVTNTGSEIAYNITVVEGYPANTVFVSSSPVPTLGNNTFIIGNLSAGASTTVNITLNISATFNGTLNNTANVTFANSTGQLTTQNVSASTIVNVLNPPVPGGNGGGGGGGGGAGSSGVSTFTNFQQQQLTQNFKVNDKVSLSVSDEIHQITIIDVTTTTVTIEVASVPRRYTILLGEALDIDMTSDNMADISVRVEAISYPRALITLQRVSRPLPLARQVPAQTNRPTTPAKPLTPLEEANTPLELYGKAAETSALELPVPPAPTALAREPIDSRIFLALGIAILVLVLTTVALMHRGKGKHAQNGQLKTPVVKTAATAATDATQTKKEAAREKHAREKAAREQAAREKKAAKPAPAPKAAPVPAPASRKSWFTFRSKSVTTPAQKEKSRDKAFAQDMERLNREMKEVEKLLKKK